MKTKTENRKGNKEIRQPDLATIQQGNRISTIENTTLANGYLVKQIDREIDIHTISLEIVSDILHKQDKAIENQRQEIEKQRKEITALKSQIKTNTTELNGLCRFIPTLHIQINKNLTTLINNCNILYSKINDLANKSDSGKAGK